MAKVINNLTKEIIYFNTYKDAFEYVSGNYLDYTIV